MSRGINILLAEDDMDDVELFRELFKCSNIEHSLGVVMQGDAVIPHITQNGANPDIIVMDLNLPKVHGKDILIKLKSMDHLKDIPVVILSTSNAINDIEFCLQHGAEKFISKPTDSEGFDAMVKAIAGIATGHPDYHQRT
jgi:CheY-like chemotaxis protein